MDRLYSEVAELLIHPKCKGSQIKCCGEFRCEPCHVKHLNESHSYHAKCFALRNPGPQVGYKEGRKEKLKKPENPKTLPKEDFLKKVDKLSSFEKAQLLAILSEEVSQG